MLLSIPFKSCISVLGAFLTTNLLLQSDKNFEIFRLFVDDCFPLTTLFENVVAARIKLFYFASVLAVSLQGPHELFNANISEFFLLSF